MKIAFYGDSLTQAVPGVSYVNLLRAQLPEHTLINYGLAGDTALSLYRRIRRLKLARPIDLAFLWIGVNDILVNISPISPIIKRLVGQPWARSPEEFREHYRDLLDLLTPCATRLVAVSPLSIGEEPDNRWNRRLGELNDIIAGLTAGYPTVTYLDMRPAFFAHVGERPVPAEFYLSRGIHAVVADAIMLVRSEDVDRVSRQRGLHLTLDGVHLNSAGARLVADQMLQVIRAVEAEAPQPLPAPCTGEPARGR